MRTKYLISLKLMLQVLEFVCSIASLENKIKEETKKGRNVMLLRPAAIIFAFLVLPRFFSFSFSLFIPNFKTIFHFPFCSYFSFSATSQNERGLKSR